nr:MAG TPA: Terminase [Caudoviricetes sp.]
MDDILKRIETWEKLYSEVKDRGTVAYLNLLNSMRNDYEQNHDNEKCMKICNEMQSLITQDTGKYKDAGKLLLAVYDTKARLGDFRSYCIAMEWNRPIEKQFFLPRRKILEKHGLIQAMQDVADDKLDFLFVSMPPRTAKSTTGIFFLSFMAGLYPERSILGNGHSTALTQSFYTEMLNLMTSEEYRFSEIFPMTKIVNKSAEYSWIDLNSDKRFHTITFKSLTGGTTGIVEASNILYCDDLIKGIEEVNNPNTLDNIFHMYTSTIQDRTVQRLCKDGEYRRCPEIHIATRWSLNDVIGRLISIYGEIDSDRIRIINIPCYDDNGESNFQYDYGKGFSTDYYKKLQMAEDPVVFAAKYLGEPIEREGRPFTKDQLTFYQSLPDEEPDRIIAYADVAHGGDDYFSMPIGYVYGTEVYIEDVLFVHKLGDSDTRPLVKQKLIDNHVTKAGFEENNGGKLYADFVIEDLRRANYRCNITTHKVPTTKSKLDRILACQSEIKGVLTEVGNYRIYFKSDNARKDNKQYNDFMMNIYSWSQKQGSVQKTQHDDAPDSLSGMIINILDLSKRAGRASSKFSLDKIGL